MSASVAGSSLGGSVTGGSVSGGSLTGGSMRGSFSGRGGSPGGGSSIGKCERVAKVRCGLNAGASGFTSRIVAGPMISTPSAYPSAISCRSATQLARCHLRVRAHR